MKQQYDLLRILYRVWFYSLTAIPLLILFPILITFAVVPKGYRTVYWIARNLWAPVVLCGMGTPINYIDTNRLATDKPYMICPNHQSMLDLFIILRCSTAPVLFVGKKELQTIPFFGSIYKRVSVLVDRSNKESRANVYQLVKEKLHLGYSICVFPEGTVPERKVLLAPFKPGAFKMAIEHSLAIIPISIYNAKHRLPYELNHGTPGKIAIKIHPTILTDELSYEDYPKLQESCRSLLERDLSVVSA